MPPLLPLLPRILAPLQPALHTVRHYRLAKFRKDIIAGLTISVVEVPQAMAYALVAGVPPQYGLYTSVLQGILGALLSSSEHLTTGPTNTQSLLIASAVTRYISLTNGNPADVSLYIGLVFCLTLMKGIIQLAFAAARLGNLVRYVSRSVILGIAAGAGVLIIVGQLPNFLGIPPDALSGGGGGAHHLPGAVGALERLWPHLNEANGRAVILGIACLAVVIGMTFISKLLPGALAAVVLAAAAVAALHWSGGSSGAPGNHIPAPGLVPTIDALPRTWPSFHLPPLSWARSEALFGGALALALLGMLESVAIVKAIAAKSGERIDPNQEFFAQGFKNFLTSFFQCIPGSGSFTRSALDYAAGAATRFAAVFNALFVAIIYIFCAQLARFIPLASLAAVLLVIAIGLIDPRTIRRLFQANRADGIVCLATAAATILLPLEYAIFIGIFLSLALYLRQTTRLHLSQMETRPGGIFIERPLTLRGTSGGGRQQDIRKSGQHEIKAGAVGARLSPAAPITDAPVAGGDARAPLSTSGVGSSPINRSTDPPINPSGVLFLQLEGDLFFGVADELQDRLTQVAAPAPAPGWPVRVVVIRLKRTHSVDSTVLAVLEDFAKRMQARGGHVILCGLKPELMAMLERYGLVGVIGRENVFPTDPNPGAGAGAGVGVFTSAKRALQRARQLVHDSIDLTGLDLDEDDAWGYVI